VKNIRIICNCRVVSLGIFFLIGTALGIFTFLLLSTEIRADEFSGPVGGISDGDTINVMHDGRAEKIRLYGIDAPEKGQAFGNRVNGNIENFRSHSIDKELIRMKGQKGRQGDQINSAATRCFSEEDSSIRTTTAETFPR